MARKYEFYFRVVKTIFYERAQRVLKYCLLPPENKNHIFKLPCNFLFVNRQECFCTNNSVKAGNDVTSEDMKRKPLESRM